MCVCERRGQQWCAHGVPWLCVPWSSIGPSNCSSTANEQHNDLTSHKFNTDCCLLSCTHSKAWATACWEARERRVFYSWRHLWHASWKVVALNAGTVFFLAPPSTQMYVFSLGDDERERLGRFATKSTPMPTSRPHNRSFPLTLRMPLLLRVHAMRKPVDFYSSLVWNTQWYGLSRRLETCPGRANKTFWSCGGGSGQESPANCEVDSNIYGVLTLLLQHLISTCRSSVAPRLHKSQRVNSGIDNRALKTLSSLTASYTCVYVCIYVCLYIDTHIYTYVYTYTYIYVYTVHIS